MSDIKKMMQLIILCCQNLHQRRTAQEKRVVVDGHFAIRFNLQINADATGREWPHNAATLLDDHQWCIQRR